MIAIYFENLSRKELVGGSDRTLIRRRKRMALDLATGRTSSLSSFTKRSSPQQPSQLAILEHTPSISSGTDIWLYGHVTSSTIYECCELRAAMNNPRDKKITIHSSIACSLLVPPESRIPCTEPSWKISSLRPLLDTHHSGCKVHQRYVPFTIADA